MAQDKAANLHLVMAKKASKTAQGILKFSEIQKLGFKSLGIIKGRAIKGVTPAVQKIKITGGPNEGVIAYVVMVMDEKANSSKSDELLLTDLTDATTKAMKWARNINGDLSKVKTTVQ